MRLQTAAARRLGLALGLALAACHGSPLSQQPPKAGPLSLDTSYFLGSGHFMQGALAGDTYLIGLSFNGLAAFDRQSWTPQLFGGSSCARIAYQNGSAYCTHHQSELQILAWSEGDHKVTGDNVIAAPTGASFEGMALWKGKLYVAARGGGLYHLDLDGQNPVQVPLPANVKEPWDVAPLGTDQLVLADGSNGIHVLDFTADVDQPTLVSSLPLSGLSIAVNVSGTRAYVASLSGGGHAIDLSQPDKPVLRSTIADGGLVYDLREVGPVVIASAGYHQITAKWVGDDLKVIGVAASKSWAMSALDGGGVLYSAEFSIAGRYDVSDAFSPGPYMRLPMGALAPSSGSLTYSLPVQNLGDAPLLVDSIRTVGPKDGVTLQKLAGFTVPPGGTHFVSIALDSNEVLFTADSAANLGSQSFYQIRVTNGPQPGDSLPTPLVYEDLTTRSYDINAVFGGKVGVLMVGAASCPVAFYSLNAIRADLAQYVVDGEIAAFSLDPWDDHDTGDLAGLDQVFPHLLSPLTTADNHDKSQVMTELGLTGYTGPPMPVVYVVGRDGKIRFAQWGYEPAVIKRAIAEALAATP